MRIVDLSFPIRPHFRWKVEPKLSKSHAAGDVFQSTVLTVAFAFLGNLSGAPPASSHPATAVPAALAPVRDVADVQLVEHKRDQARKVQPAVRTEPAKKVTRVPEAVKKPPARAARSTARGRAAAPELQTPAGDTSPVIAFALAQLGKPYVWAAAGPNAYDCSGLVLASYARIGVRLPHQTGSMIRYGRPVSRSQLQPGDIVFPTFGHVAIYLGNGLIVHAPHAGDHVRIAKLYAFWSARRI